MRQHPYAFLFYTLLLTIGVTPVLRVLGMADWPVNLLLALSLVQAMAAVAPARLRRPLLVLVGVAVVVRLAGQFLGWGLVIEEATTAAWTVAALLAHLAFPRPPAPLERERHRGILGMLWIARLVNLIRGNRKTPDF